LFWFLKFMWLADDVALSPPLEDVDENLVHCL
jgi:hypothetical protein